MPFGSVGLRGLKDSVTSKFKGKRTEIVDLTADSPPDSAPPTDDDEAFARSLQQRYDAEELNPLVTGSFPHKEPAVRDAGRPEVLPDDDELLARELQAQFEKEDSALARAAQSDSPPPYSFDSLDRRQSDNDYDAALARKLQEEYDDERTGLSSSSPFREERVNGSDDHAFARRLQNKFNLERSSASLPATQVPDEQSGENLDPLANRRTLQRYAEAVRHTACASCGKSCVSSENEVLLKCKAWLENVGQADISSILICKCSAKTCIGCGTLSKASSGTSVVLENGRTLSWCCTRGRMGLIWMLLCGHDRRQTAQRKRDAYFKRSSAASSNANGAGNAGIGYDSGHVFSSFSSSKAKETLNAGKYGTHSGLGYAVPGSSAYPDTASSPTEAAEDVISTRLMACLDALLPSLVSETVQDFDQEPHPALPALLTQSKLLGTIAALLRNDSLEDATKRMQLYKHTLDVVSKLGSHFATARCTIHSERQEEDGGPDILSLSFASTSNKGKPKFEECQSLASLLRNFDKQSKNMLANARAHPQAFDGADSKQMLMLCTKVSDLADFLLANQVQSPTKAQKQPQNNDEWQTDMAVLEVSDDEILARHHYKSQAGQAQNQALGRMKTLSLQLSNLMTSLPPGIFVRHGPSRLDVMKILIVGPKGTPYENGLFEFDLFCPSNFPNSPPSMNLRTTGGGRVRFNPNLYNCGRVCLSLLGTWSGEPWQAGKSTILQVLVSIQAMIFCDEP